MALLDDFVRWCEDQRAILHQSLIMMESGVMHTGEQHVGAPRRDTTAESIARAKTSIAELDALLEKVVWAQLR
jgi:hypothetical protein